MRFETKEMQDFGLSVERELWKQLLQGERTTDMHHMLKTGLMSLFLEMGKFAGEDIYVSDWGDGGPIKSGSFQGAFTLAFEKSAGALGAAGPRWDPFVNARASADLAKSSKDGLSARARGTHCARWT
jgi:hypothetical protein